jgi:elongation factor 1 alpha-like protein
VEPEEEPAAPRPAIIVEQPAQRAPASMFASVLCGSSNSHPPVMEAFPVPYTNCQGYTDASGFDTPSPDDIVRAAQAKQAGGGRR